jgi:hypothetical protein
MEFASVLAGERWSDHPVCTHPLLAAVARHVNDYISDPARQGLTELVPAVIGLNGTDLRVDARIALHCAITALPVVSAERQRVLAVGILAADRVLAELDGRPPGRMEPESARALAGVPDAARWAHRFTGGRAPTPNAFRRYSAPGIVSCAVAGVATACVADSDGMLRELLVGAIEECARWSAEATVAEPAPADPVRT